MPARYQPHLEFANFICKFGRLNMADLLDEVVLPAFLDTTEVRQTSDAKYLLLHPKLENLEFKFGETPCIVGRFVKDTFLERSFILEDGELLPAEASLATAETALFILTLDTHKVVYLQETKNAPGFQAFRATILKFLKKKHDLFIRALKDQIEASTDMTLDGVTRFLEERGLQGGEIEGPVVQVKEDAENPKEKREHRPGTLAFLRQHIPVPELDIIPLSNEESLEAFINRFKTLSLVRVTLVNTNDELHLGDFFPQVEAAKAAAGSAKTSVVHNNPKGLDKAGVLDQLKEVATQGNAQTHLEGRDATDTKLVGDETQFKLRIPQSNLPDHDDVDARSKHLVNAFDEAVQAGTVVLQEPSDKLAEKMELVKEAVRKGDGRT